MLKSALHMEEVEEECMAHYHRVYHLLIRWILQLTITFCHCQDLLYLIKEVMFYASKYQLDTHTSNVVHSQILQQFLKNSIIQLIKLKRKA